ncbi:acyl-CoA dehydratase activase [Candidatus Solincola sp.]|nr:acyl-CoA dehydratase activase [Actinomycetota bacterium]MDI7252863.1 acyl-CoA dehydratase activase [Actinomycetota bacterium]
MDARCGVDLGSRFVKIAVEVDGDRRFLGPFDTAEFYRKHIEAGKDGGALRKKDFGLGEEVRVGATGYGRARLGGGAVMFPELEAIAAGVAAMTGIREAVILDVGGQDSKALLVRDGRLADFEANDRCAASAGKFLENMSRVLGMDWEELGRYREDPVELSSTCAVYGETELVGLLGEGWPVERLAAGVNRAILGRLLPLLARFPRRTLVLTGGVARNRALRAMLADRLGVEPVVPEPPDFVAAVGCCRLLLEEV